MGNIYTVKSIADEFGIHEETVRRWIRDGKLVAQKANNRCGYFVTEEDLDAFCEANDYYYDEEENTEEIEREDEITDDDILDELLRQNQKQIEQYEKQRDEALARLRVLYVIRETLESY